MGDISKIRLPNGRRYRVRDEHAQRMEAKLGALAYLDDITTEMLPYPAAVTNLNDAKEAGFYSFASSASNKPPSIGSGGAMIVLRYSASYLTQFAVANTFTNFDVAMRKYRSGTFSDWVSLYSPACTYYPRMETGGISVSKGTDMTAVNRMRTPGYTPYKAGATVTAANGYDYKIVMYDAGKVFTDASADWLSGETTVPSCGYYRIVAKNDSITDFTGAGNDFLAYGNSMTVPDWLAFVLETF